METPIANDQSQPNAPESCACPDFGYEPLFQTIGKKPIPAQIHFARHRLEQMLAPACLLALSPHVSAVGSSFDYQFESYNEEDGRVDVLSHYFNIRQQFETGTALGIRYVMDSISGATPTGTYGLNAANEWDYAEVEDDRDAVSIMVDQKIGDHLLTFEYTRSEESDYISNSYALSGKSELVTIQVRNSLACQPMRI